MEIFPVIRAEFTCAQAFGYNNRGLASFGLLSEPQGEGRGMSSCDALPNSRGLVDAAVIINSR